MEESFQSAESLVYVGIDGGHIGMLILLLKLYSLICVLLGMYHIFWLYKLKKINEFSDLLNFFPIFSFQQKQM